MVNIASAASFGCTGREIIARGWDALSENLSSCTVSSEGRS